MRVVVAVLAASLVALMPGSSATAAVERCHGVRWSDTPCLTLTPDHGATGTRVTITGTVLTHRKVWADNFRHPAYFALIRDVRTPAGVCELLNGVEDGHVRLDRATGQVHGSFVVSDHWSCFQERGRPRGIVPGTYTLSLGCHACAVGIFHRTSEALPFTGPAAVWPLGYAGAAAVLIGVATLAASRRRRVNR